MNVLYVVSDPGIPVPGTKGASIHVDRMVHAMVEAGARVHLVTARAGDSPWHGPDKTVVALKAQDRGADRRRLMDAVYDAAMKVAETYAPDVVYERYSLYGDAGIRVARRLGLPHLLEVNAPLAWEEATYRGLADRRLAEEAERRIWLSTDRLIVVSTALANRAREWGIIPDRIRVVPNGFDPARFYPGGPAAPRPEALQSLPLVAGFVGSLKPWHGVDLLLAAIRPLADVGLLIVGDGPERERLAQTAERLGVAARTVFTGAVGADRVRGYYQAMDVVVAPYRPERTVPFYFSPLKIIEAMATGAAVVAPALGDIPAWLGEERGFLFTPGDVSDLTRTLATLRDRPHLRRTAGARAAAWAHASRSWRQVADRVLTFPRGVAL